MNDFEITAEAMDSRAVLVSTPFSPVLLSVIDGDQVVQKVRFNQGYIFDYLGGDASLKDQPMVIENMDELYELPSEEEPDALVFYVELEVEPETGEAYYATFNKAKEEDYKNIREGTDPILKIGTPQNTITKYITVAIFEKFGKGGVIRNLYLRDNIHWWGKKITQTLDQAEYVAHPVIIDTGSTGEGVSRPLQIRAISGRGYPDYKIVDVFEAKSDPLLNENDLIIVSGITGNGVMYGEGSGPDQETYRFLPYPPSIAESPNGYGADSWAWFLIAGGDPPSAPTWAERQHLPPADQGDILYYDEHQEQWIVLNIPPEAAESENGYSNAWEHRLIADGDPPEAPAWAERQYLPQVADGSDQGDILYYDVTQKQWVMLNMPPAAAQSEGGYSDSWEHRLITNGNPPSLPVWEERQYLPQVAEGAAQGDILYYDATEQQWVILDAPTSEEMSDFQDNGGNPVLHHDGTVPYWDNDGYDIPSAP